MITSKITGKTYEPGNEHCVYFSNMLQCAKYFKTLGEEFFLDILYTSKKRRRLSCLRMGKMRRDTTSKAAMGPASAVTRCLCE